MAPARPVQALIEQALRESTADGCVVVAADGDRSNLRWANNRLTSNGQAHQRELTVICVYGGADGARAGVLTRPVAEPDDVTALVRDSQSAARQAQPSDDAADLIEPAGGPETGGPEPTGSDPDWDAPAARSDIEALAGFADQLAAACRRAQVDDRALFGFAHRELISTFVASSTGLRRRFDQPDGAVELNVKSSDGRRSVWAGRAAADVAAVDLAQLEGELLQRYEWTARRVELPAGRYDTVLPPSAVADLLVYAYWTMGARDAEEGRTVFSGRGGGTRIGQRLSTMPLTLRSDPNAAGLSCAPFEVVTESISGVASIFDNGAPVTAVEWIRSGVLTELARSRSWAGRTGRPFRPLVGNLILDAEGSGTELDLIADVERGLLLTSLWYIREVDPQTLLLTGLTRDGVFLVENGAVTAAVNNFRFNESPVGLLGRITAAGKTVPAFPREWGDYFSRAHMPPLKVSQFNMSTVSRAT